MTGSHIDPILADRVRTSRAMGADDSFVLHGGGNTSAKGTVMNIHGEEIEVLFVKGSGWDLATIEAPGFPACDLAALRALRSVEAMDDETMVREIRRTMLDPTGPTPSVETLLHAFLPHRFIDHSHADAIIALSNRPDGASICREVFGDRVIHLPWIFPGFPLAKAVADAVDAAPDTEGVLLHNHGLFTFGETADEALAKHQELVALAASQYASDREAVLAGEGIVRISWSEVLPRLRGALSSESQFVFDTRSEPWMLAALDRPDAQEVLLSAPLTPDHTLRCKCLPCWVDPEEACFGDVIARYATAYDAYVDRGIEHFGPRKRLDSMPRVLLVPGCGIIGVGSNAKAAAAAADIAEHTVLTKLAGLGKGAYQGLSERELFEMEYWSLEQTKLAGKKRAPLEGKVAVITGGAGAIGEGIAHVLAEAGAHIALLDLDVSAAEAAAQRVGPSVLAVGCDVTCEHSMATAMDAVCRRFGGFDILVPNAGIAHSAMIDEHDVAAFRKVVEVNETGTFITLQAGIRVLKAQGIGGSIVLISSKNVYGPGAAFGAYSASKAGMHQLGRVAAMEVAQHGITVNMVLPDAVFGCGDNSSGLWDEIGPDRARDKGLDPEQLQAHYRERNLLKAVVNARDVGEAVLFFAEGRTPTTGGVLMVDGGVAAAFPR
ncbi:MAG: bifunctional aldolase/short-chain dehydrogenase [Phycisphaerales bacterium]|nr:bifunctional aldolase/short-chain dehydrogenase [Phycisphaerales bacterium]